MANLILKIYLAPSGQWSGIIIDADYELGRVAGCADPDEVEQAAYDAGYFFDQVEMV